MSEHKFTTFDPNADFFKIMYDNDPTLEMIISKLLKDKLYNIYKF